MPRRNSPPTPSIPGSAPGSDMSEGDFVILPRHSLDNANNMAGSQQQADLQLQSQLSPTSVNGGTNMVTVMQYDQLVNTARSMKDENNMLRDQLTEMVQTMEARTVEFGEMKSRNRQVTERCKEIRKLANLEVTRLRNQVKSLTDQVEQETHLQEEVADLQTVNTDLQEKLHSYELKVEQLETELKDKIEEVVVSFGSGTSDSVGGEAPAKVAVSLLTQLKEDIKDVQGTRADIKTNMSNLEEALQKSAVDLRHYKQRADLLMLEKQDLLALNNELQTQVSTYSGMQRDGSQRQSMAEAGSDVTEPGDAREVFEMPPIPFSPGKAMQKSNLALQDVLLQLQAERDKVSSLMEDLKQERGHRNRIETTLMKQLYTSSGEHDIAVEELAKRHSEQVEELVKKIDELTVANQEPHHSMELKQQVRSLVFELQERENTLQQKGHSVEELRAVNEALKSKISLYHDELEAVRKQDSHMIETLRGELQRQQAMFQSERQKGLVEKEHFNQLKEEYNQLFADYDNLTRKYEELRARSTQAVNAMNATALLELAEQRDNLTAQLMSAEEAIGAKETQLQKAQRDLQEAKTELETIPVLQAQAEIYRNDFDAERAAREKAHMEKEALMAELENLREDSQRMQEDLASHAKTQLQQMQHRHGSSSSGSMGGGLYERFIRHPIFGSSSSPRNGHGFGQGQESDEPFIMAEADPGVDVDRPSRGALDEGGIGVISPGIGGHQDQNQAYPHFGKEENDVYSTHARANPNCPKCLNEFPDIDTLQIHMLDCIK